MLPAQSAIRKEETKNILRHILLLTVDRETPSFYMLVQVFPALL